MASSARATPAATLRITEIFHSIQGESTWAGSPCVFIRLTGCHLRCTYCDTEYAFREGEHRSIESVFEEVHAIGCPLVEITGGEPLLQDGVHELIARLCDAGHTVLIETSGACDISRCDSRAIRIMDIKTPGSGEVDRNDLGNMRHLTDRDEVKFVITDRADYEWAHGLIEAHDLTNRVQAVLLSPVFEQPAGREIAGARAMEASDLARWMLEDRLEARLQLQLHKFIWSPHARGV